MSDLFDVRGGTMVLANPVLTGISGAATTFSYTSTPAFSLKGRLYTGDAASGAATPDVDANTAEAFVPLTNGDQCLFVFGWLADGTTVVAQGPVVRTADVVNKSSALAFPAIPDTVCPYAYFSVANANATAWLFSTGLWNASDLTVGTVVNVCMLPTQPLTAASAA